MTNTLSFQSSLVFHNLRIKHSLLKKIKSPNKILHKLFSNLFSLNFFTSISECWDRLGTSLLFSRCSFNNYEWYNLSQMWKNINSIINVIFGRQKSIYLNKYRSSKIRLIWGNENWITHKENEIIYGFDMTRSMFSSGNGTEKYRVSSSCKKNEIILDFYSGVGYFSLPYLNGQTECLVAFEWNPYAFEALQLNIKTNKFSFKSRALLVFGNNQKRMNHLINCVYSINLGLIPFVRTIYFFSVLFIKVDGIIHIHRKINRTKTQSTLEKIMKILKEMGKKLNKIWTPELISVHSVKKYGPKINHVVIDVKASLKKQKNIS